MQTFWKNVEDMSSPFLLKYFENGPFIWLSHPRGRIHPEVCISVEIQTLQYSDPSKHETAIQYLKHPGKHKTFA